MLLSVPNTALASHWGELHATELDEPTRHRMVRVQYHYIAPYSVPNIPAVGTTNSLGDAIAIVKGLNHAYAKDIGVPVVRTTVTQQPWRFITDKTGCGFRVRIYDSDECADSGVVYQTYVTSCIGSETACDTASANQLVGSVIKRMYYDYVMDGDADVKTAKKTVTATPAGRAEARRPH